MSSLGTQDPVSCTLQNALCMQRQVRQFLFPPFLPFSLFFSFCTSFSPPSSFPPPLSLPPSISLSLPPSVPPFSFLLALLPCLLPYLLPLFFPPSLLTSLSLFLSSAKPSFMPNAEIIFCIIFQGKKKRKEGVKKSGNNFET